MKTNIFSECPGEVSLDTAVLYKWRPFLPSVSSEYLTDEQRSKLLSESKAYKVLHASSSVNSDLIDFAEYGFDHKVKKDSFGSYLKTNSLDKKSLALVGNNLSDLEKVESFAVPQLSDEEKEIEDTVNPFFGCINVDSKSIYLLDLPGEEWKFNDDSKKVVKEKQHTFYIGDIGYFILHPLTYSKCTVEFSDLYLNTDFSSISLESIQETYAGDETISNIILKDNLLFIQKADGTINISILSLKYPGTTSILSSIVKLANELNGIFRVGYNISNNMTLDEFYSMTEPEDSDEEPEYVHKKVGDQTETLYLYDDVEHNYSEDLISRGIYKIEFYNTAKVPEEGQTEEDLYTDIDVLDYLGLIDKSSDEKIIIPMMTVVLGPENNCPNNLDENYYKFDKLYYDFDDTSQIEFDNDVLNKYNYSNLIQEITNRKVLYVVTDSESNSTDINLSLESWKVSNNPNRNQSKYSLRNDFLDVTKNGIKIFKEDHGLAIDKNSYILLGNSGININDTKEFPLLSRKYKKCKNNINSYHDNIVYSLTDKVNCDLREWTSGVVENINENPEYSPVWITNESNWLLSNKDYVEVSISQSKVGGTISPTGLRSFKRGCDIVFDLDLKDEYEVKKITRVGSLNDSSDIPSCDYSIYKEDGKDKLVMYNFNSKSDDTYSLFFEIGKIKSNLNVSWIYQEDYYTADDDDPQSPSGYEFKVTSNGEDISKANYGDTVEVEVIQTSTDDDWVYSFIGYRLSSEGGSILHEVEGNKFSFKLLSRDEAIGLVLAGREYTVEIINTEGCEVEKEYTKVRYGKPFETKYYVFDGYKDEIYNNVTNDGVITITDANTKKELILDWSISGLDENYYRTFTINRVEKDLLIDLKFKEDAD